MTSTALHYEILAAMAEEESYAKSVNTKWGIRESMKKGNVKLNYSQFLGYTKDTSGELVIIPEEAEIVRLIITMKLSSIRKHGKRYSEEKPQRNKMQKYFQLQNLFPYKRVSVLSSEN